MLVDVTLLRSPIKPKADSTLRNMRKADLIEYVRSLEHNHNVAVSFNEQQARNIEKILKEKGIETGRWIWNENACTWDCTNCHGWVSGGSRVSAYVRCPFCGAVMTVV